MILSSVSDLHSDLEVGFVVLDFEADYMTQESLRDSCVRSSIVVKVIDDKASLMCITPGASFKSMPVVCLIDNYLLVAARGFIGAGLFEIQRPATSLVAYPDANQCREAVMGLGKKLVMERELKSAFQRLKQVQVYCLQEWLLRLCCLWLH